MKYTYDDRQIIVVEPHPDDAFIGLYHTLNGIWDRVFLITLTRGEIDWKTKIVNHAQAWERDKETKAFIKEFSIIGHKQYDLGDGKILHESVRKVATALEGPSALLPLVFIPSLEDEHPDHKVVAEVFHFDCKLETIQYCIDDPDRRKHYYAPHILESYQEGIKREWFAKLYPSQKIATATHKGVQNRMSREFISWPKH